ncbi:DMT family transporter [Aquipuribacter sp. MA13-6]|uniref:DMT family transporter n=1 Tax=unclassified Aquipuribacter TaxID=2635084 RepID=UPI003EEB2FF1
MTASSQRDTRATWSVVVDGTGDRVRDPVSRRTGTQIARSGSDGEGFGQIQPTRAVAPPDLRRRRARVAYVSGVTPSRVERWRGPTYPGPVRRPGTSATSVGLTPAAVGATEPGPDHDRRRHGLLVVLSLLGTVAVGLLVAAQSRINGELAPVLVPAAEATLGWRGPAPDRVAAGLDAALLSFGIGWVVVVVGALVTPRGRRGLRALRTSVRAGGLRWWQMLGGVGGAAFVAAQGIAVPVLGVAVFTVTVVAGLTVGGLLVDRQGLSPNGARPFTVRRVLGCLLAVGGVGLSVSGSLAGGLTTDAGVVAFVLVLGLAMVVGVGTAAQQAVNGHVAVRSGSPWTAGVVNFTAGVLSLLVLRLALVGTVTPAPLPSGWWAYLSGPIGLSFIVLAALLVRTLGVLVLGLGNTAGQLVGSIALDELLPTAAGRPGPVELVAAVVIFAAVALAASRPRRPRREPPGPTVGDRTPAGTAAR